MDLSQITPDIAVAPQIDAADFANLAEAGFVAVIDNRPDDEVDHPQQSAQMAEAARRAGLEFHYHPVVPGEMSDDAVRGLRGVLAAADGPVVAYCRSGTRSAMVWALAQAGQRSADDILRLAADAGYDLRQLAPVLRGQAR